MKQNKTKKLVPESKKLVLMSSCFCGSMSKNEHLPTCYLVFKINREKRRFVGPTWHKAKQPRQGKELQKIEENKWEKLIRKIIENKPKTDGVY